MIPALSFILGTLLASFVGVIAQRLHVAPIVNARSKCLSCSHVLSWKDMMPMASCLLLGGRCRYCQTKFGYSHAFFEFSFGILFAFLAYKYIVHSESLFSYVDVLPLVLQMCITICLGVIFLYDIAHRILPKYFLFTFLLLSLFPLLFRVVETGSYYELFAPVLVALPYLILFLLTLGRGVGFGDVLLFFGVGAILGLSSGFLVFLLSLWIGTLTILPLLYFKVVTKKSLIPFAPFIIISYFLVLFTSFDLNTLTSFIYRVML